MSVYLSLSLSVCVTISEYSFLLKWLPLHFIIDQRVGILCPNCEDPQPPPSN